MLCKRLEDRSNGVATGGPGIQADEGGVDGWTDEIRELGAKGCIRRQRWRKDIRLAVASIG